MANKYLDETGLAYLVNKIKQSSGGGSDAIVNVTSAFTSSNSRIQVLYAYKSGKVINVELGIARTSAWATGSSNDITSVITSSYLPIQNAYCAHVWGSGAVYGIFEGAGIGTAQSTMVSFRNNSGGSISKSSGDTVNMTFSYIYNDGTLI